MIRRQIARSGRSDQREDEIAFVVLGSREIGRRTETEALGSSCFRLTADRSGTATRAPIRTSWSRSPIVWRRPIFLQVRASRPFGRLASAKSFVACRLHQELTSLDATRMIDGSSGSRSESEDVTMMTVRTLTDHQRCTVTLPTKAVARCFSAATVAGRPAPSSLCASRLRDRRPQQ